MTLTRGNTNDPLSPNARAVADAFWRACLGEPQTFKSDMRALASALRAAAEKVEALPLSTDYIFWDSGHEVGIIRAVDKLLAIADELDDTADKTDD